MREELVRLGDAAVYRDDDGASLEEDFDPAVAPVVIGEAARLGLEDATWVAGTLLPGAASVLLVGGRTAVGDGVWIGLLPAGDVGPVLVAQHDGAGGVMRAPLPAGATAEPIADADTTCPACGGRRWQAVTEPGGGRPVECAACGLTIGLLDGWSMVTATLDETDAHAEPVFDAEALHGEQRRRLRQVVAGAVIPVLAPEGFAVELGRWAGADDAASAVELHHAGTGGVTLSVDTDRPDDNRGWFPADASRDAERRLLDLLAAPAAAGSGSLPAHVVAAGVAELQRDRRLASDPPRHGTHDLSVDGADLAFVVVAAQHAWVAKGPVGDCVVTVAARGIAIDAVRLRTVADADGLGGDPTAVRYVAERPRRDRLDPERVRDLVAGTGVEDLADALVAAARPSLAVVPNTAETGSSWLGGDPELPPDATWPDFEGRPMAFVAQLALDELDPAVWTGPRTGHLHVFAGLDPEAYFVDDKGAVAVLHSPAGADLRPASADVHEDLRTPRTPVAFRTGLTLPADGSDWLHRRGFGHGGDRYADADDYGTVATRLEVEQGWEPRGDRLLGWPRLNQDDFMGFLAGHHEQDPADWTLLLQTGMFDALLDIALPAADLAAGRFDRAEGITDYD